MSNDVISEIKRDHIMNLLAKGTRTDGRSPTDIRKIEIIKNGKAVYTLNPDTRDVDFTFTDDASDSTDYYYLRVEQVDDHIAWSSPIYVN